jgi:hypothetical protein
MAQSLRINSTIFFSIYISIVYAPNQQDNSSSACPESKQYMILSSALTRDHFLHPSRLALDYKPYVGKQVSPYLIISRDGSLYSSIMASLILETIARSGWT